jgi:hypothetical protein
MLALLPSRASGAHAWRELLKIVAGANVAAAYDSCAAHRSRGFAVLQNAAGDVHSVLAFESCITSVVKLAQCEGTCARCADVHTVFETPRVQEELKRLQDRYKQLDTQLAGVHRCLLTLHLPVFVLPSEWLLIADCMLPSQARQASFLEVRCRACTGSMAQYLQWLAVPPGCLRVSKRSVVRPYGHSAGAACSDTEHM